MGIKVNVDLSKFNQKFSQTALNKARKLALNDAHQAMDKYVPYLHGDLSKTSVLSVDGTAVIYTMPYAKAQFYGLVGPKPGYPVTHWTTATHPQASKRWDLKVKGNKADMKGIKDAFVKGLDL